VALEAHCGLCAATVLFDPFWPPYVSPIHAQSVACTPFWTASSFKMDFTSQLFVSVVMSVETKRWPILLRLWLGPGCT
jgi:hypothetical protein